MAAPIKTHGIGKGLMTVWQATNPDAGNFPAGTIFGGRKFMDVSPVSTSSSEHSLRQGKRPPRQAKVKVTWVLPIEVFIFPLLYLI